MANGNDDPRIYQALALPERALENGGLEILCVSAFVAATSFMCRRCRPSRRRPQWGMLLAEVAVRARRDLRCAERLGFSKKDVTTDIAEAFAAQMGARPAKPAKKPAKTVAKKAARKKR